MGHDEQALVLGSDGIDMIEAVGEDVDQFTAGDEVIINPARRWHENSNAPPKEFDILEMPDDGTFAEKLRLQFRKRNALLMTYRASLFPRTIFFTF